MKFFTTLYTWYGKRTVLVVAGAFIGLSGIAIASALVGTVSDVESDPASLPIVRVAPAAETTSDFRLELIGSVRPLEQATIQADAGGQITSVPVALGDTVAANAVIATVENASVRAALTQAQGAYEAAQANAAQSDVGVREAEIALQDAQRSVVNTIRASHTEVDNALKSTIAEMFTNDIGFRVETYRPIELVTTRNHLLNELERWRQEIETTTPDSNLDIEVERSVKIVTDTGIFLDRLFSIIAAAKPDEALTDSTPAVIANNIKVTRSALNTTRSNLANALARLENAREGVVRAQVNSSSNNGPSVANAQIKQALGSLQAAQANVEKTIFRTPISGTVNNLSIHRGDYVSNGQTVALVANNNAYEITAFINQQDRTRIAIGDTVRIADTHTGTITRIAPAVSAVTGKVEVKITTEATDLIPGDTVSVSIVPTDLSDEKEPGLEIPITAVKFTADSAVVFTVVNNTLVAQPVTIGDIHGSSIAVTSGLSPETEIVLDARGRSNGDSVEAVRASST